MNKQVETKVKRGAKKGKLTPKQERWCEEYLIDLNATQAAIRAGYNPRNAKQQGTENLAKPSLMRVVNAEIEKRKNRTGVSADQVLLDLREIADICMGRKIIPNGVVVDGKVIGDNVAEFNPTAANKSLELLGKHFRLFADLIVHENKLEDMSDAELIQYEAEIDGRLAELKKANTRH